MKDFDAPDSARSERLSKAKGFKIGGIAFNCVRDMHPQVLVDYDKQITESEGLGETIDAISGYIRNAIAPAERAGWDQLRSNTEEPITLDDMSEIQEALVEQYSNRPTERPSDSGGSLETTGTNSTEFPSTNQESL